MGWRGGACMADTTGGSAMGYRIMKYTSLSRASPHLSWGSQISQVTAPPLLTIPSSSRGAALQRAPAAVCTSVVRWSRSDSSQNPSCCSAPLAFCCHTADGDKICFLVPCRREKKKNIQEMKAVIRSCVCQASPRAGTKGPEKSCWVYFGLHLMWKPGKGREKRPKTEIILLLDCSWGWSVILVAEGAAVMNRSPSSHRYSCTKQNKLPLLAPVFQQREKAFVAWRSRISQHPPKEGQGDKEVKAGRFKLALHTRSKRGEVTHQYHPSENCG